MPVRMLSLFFSAEVNGGVSISRMPFLQLVLGSRLLDVLILSMEEHKMWRGEFTRPSFNMGRIALVVTFLIGMLVPSLAQKAEIEAVNAKWTEYFNKGDFAGLPHFPQALPW